MPTYLIKSDITITRQEGDVADIVITVPVLLSMTGKTAKFSVFDTNNKAIIAKTTGTLTIDGQVITIQLLPADTLRKAGKHRWELEVVDANGPITIGRGPFVIVKTDIV